MKHTEIAPVLRLSSEALPVMDAESNVPPSISRAASLLGRRGGIVKTPKKAAACRVNGMRGGRPNRSSS